MPMKTIHRNRYFQITLHGACVGNSVIVVAPCIYLGRRRLGRAGTGYILGGSWLLWEGNVKLFFFSKRWRLMREISAAKKKAEK